ncbi:MAG: hypothetical protein LBC92_04430 [Rickettsiales bacterium]|jgi:hypothetical protein|nr:hypothetical protein [Rickettsiales bacterium]
MADNSGLGQGAGVDSGTVFDFDNFNSIDSILIENAKNSGKSLNEIEDIEKQISVIANLRKSVIDNDFYNLEPEKQNEELSKICLSYGNLIKDNEIKFSDEEQKKISTLTPNIYVDGKAFVDVLNSKEFIDALNNPKNKEETNRVLNSLCDSPDEANDVGRALEDLKDPNKREEMLGNLKKDMEFDGFAVKKDKSVCWYGPVLLLAMTFCPIAGILGPFMPFLQSIAPAVFPWSKVRPRKTYFTKYKPKEPEEKQDELESAGKDGKDELETEKSGKDELESTGKDGKDELETEKGGKPNRDELETEIYGNPMDEMTHDGNTQGQDRLLSSENEQKPVDCLETQVPNSPLNRIGTGVNNTRGSIPLSSRGSNGSGRGGI